MVAVVAVVVIAVLSSSVTVVRNIYRSVTLVAVIVLVPGLVVGVAVVTDSRVYGSVCSRTGFRSR